MDKIGKLKKALVKVHEENTTLKKAISGKDQAKRNEVKIMKFDKRQKNFNNFMASCDIYFNFYSNEYINRKHLIMMLHMMGEVTA